MTATIDVDDIAKIEPQRDGNNRYVLLWKDDKGKLHPRSHTRATTIASTISDHWAIEQWELRMLAYGLVRRDDLVSLALTHDPDNDRSVYTDIINKAHAKAETDRKAGHGTALHAAVDKYDSGTPLSEIPERFHERLTEYRRATDEAGLTFPRKSIERVVSIDAYKLAGQVDRLGATTADGLPVVSDLKTGSLHDSGWVDKCAQLAIYANHDAVHTPQPNGDPAKRSKRIDVDRNLGLIIHLPQDGGPCTIHEADLELGWDIVLASLEARALRNAAKKAHRPHAPGAPAEAVRQWVATRVQIILDAHDDGGARLLARWPDTVPKPMPAALTDDQIDAMSKACSLVEAELGVPFGPERPGVRP